MSLTLLATSCLILPTISETHLLSNIQEKELSISVGTEQLLGIDARFDFIDMFTDDSPLSVMLLGGVLLFSGGSGPVVHFGAAANYQINRIGYALDSRTATSGVGNSIFSDMFHHRLVGDRIGLHGLLHQAVE